MGVLGEVEESLRSSLDRLLDEYPAWPRREFNLMMESRELYQDTTATAIDYYDEVSRVDVDGKKFYCYNNTSKSDIRNSEPYNKKFRIDQFLSESGNMANLATYIAICKVYDELNIPEMEVRPEDDFRMTLYHTGRVPDAFISFSNEYVPVEVYNGGDYVNSRNDKHDQLMDLKSDEDDDIECNPMFFNRRSTGNYKEKMVKRNITIVDTDWIIASESLYSEYQDAIRFFELDSLVHVLSKLEVANGDLFDGNDYDIQENGAQNHTTKERNSALLPPTQMTTDADKLPPDYIPRIRGGIQLHYVYTRYRTTSDSRRGAASLVVQNMYNNLLRAESGIPRTDAVAQGWEDATEQYDWIGQFEKPEVNQEVDEIIQELRNAHVIRKYEDRLTPRGGTHPQPSFSMYQ